MPPHLNTHVSPSPGSDVQPPRRLFGLPLLGRAPSIFEQNEANESLNLERNSVTTNVDDLPRVRVNRTKSTVAGMRPGRWAEVL